MGRRRSARVPRQPRTQRQDRDDPDRRSALTIGRSCREDQPDNRIIAVALDLKGEGKRAVFVSKDISARIKSDSLGIVTEDFENQKVDADRLYRGWIEVEADGQTIDDLYDDKMLSLRAPRVPALSHRA
ncbi:MAG: hypothetical protein IPJ41_04550 [Phycisphaerales bacterium]|nr:hypothetical protein [Phycisphaerales bacterium]